MTNQISVISMVPKFLKFFELAKDEKDKEKRFELRRENYGFAAVPPGDTGLEIARNLLETAWEKYPELVESLKDWEADITAIHEKVVQVKQLFKYEEEIDFNVLFYVGGFEGNPFVAPLGDGKLTLCLPVETKISDVFLAHELTHIVHFKISGITDGFERSIATLILQEGLATRASQMVVPDLQEEAYIEDVLNPGWLEACHEHRDIILDGIRPYLSKKDIESLNKFTFGKGTSGVVNREAYYVGWILVEYLLNSGETMVKLASIPENRVDEFIDQTIENYLLLNHSLEPK